MAMASGLALVAATPAVAAPVITIVSGSGTYGNNDLTCVGAAPCTFTDTITFVTPTGYNLASLTLGSSMVGNDMATNVDFTSVTLNGVNFNIILTGYTEFRNLLNQVIVAGATNTLTVSGTTGGNGSYGGSLSFANAPLPEAATWAMMLAGFGAMGTMMRRRKTSVSFA